MLQRIFAIAAFTAVALSGADNASDQQLFEQVDTIVATLSRITGWKASHRIPASVIHQDEFRRFVEKRMKKSASPKEVRIQNLALHMFGLVPPEFDIEQSTVELVSEQTAAFYDYEKRHLYMLDTPSTDQERQIALVHELAHALADQNFPLGKYLRQGSITDDGATARQAVIEGQATWLMWAFMSERNGGPAKVTDDLLQSLAGAVENGASKYPVYSNSPLYMRETLLFPYTKGLLFQNEVFRSKGAASFGEVFRRAPESTQQILHPAKYIENEAPVKLEAPKPRTPRDYHELATGSLGELDELILLRQHAPDDQPEVMAAHLRGAQFSLWEHKKSKKPLLTNSSEWDSPESAMRYFQLYEKVMRSKWKKMEPGPRGETSFSGEGDTGFYRVSLEGARVLVWEGLSSALD